MSSGNSPSSDRLTIHIDATDLPSDKETRATLSVELGTAIRDVLSMHGIEEPDLQCINGHVYAGIAAQCPDCNTELELSDLACDTSNSARTTTRCDCGWSGDVIYQLIDLHDHTEESTEVSDTDSEPLSSIHRHGIEPQYTSY